MALTRRTPSSGGSGEAKDIQIDNLEEREYEARVVAVADLGLQHQEYAGEVKPDCQQIALGYEVLGETYTVDGEEKPRMLWGKPFNIFSTLTEKGNELKYYSVFEPSAEAGDIPDWEAQIGKPCMIYIKHVEGKGENKGNVYDNIVKVDPIPAKYQDAVPPATITDLGIGDADDENNPVTRALFGLPKYVYDKRIGGNNPNEPQNTANTAPSEPDDDAPY